MSLTREEWEEMWEVVRVIERTIGSFNRSTHSPKAKAKVLRCTARIKEMIQSVIGQME